MSQELSTVGSQLRSAVDRYARSCSSVRDACLGTSRINNAPEFLTTLEKESNDIVLYTQTLEEAQAAIQLARSSISRVGCGNKLPVEILTRIFDLAPSDSSCLVQRDDQRQISSIRYPLYPDSLAHVCSYWRRVAIAHPSLWTHIDIALDHYLNPGLFARAKTYVIRAGHLPLEIHISDPGLALPRDETRRDETERRPCLVSRKKTAWRDQAHGLRDSLLSHAQRHFGAPTIVANTLRAYWK